MSMEEIVVPVVAVGGLWTMVTALGVSAFVVSMRNTREVNETVRSSVQAGHPLSAEALALLRRAPRSPAQDLRTGGLLTATAVGFAVCAGMAAVVEGGDDWVGFAIAGILLGSLGVGHLLVGWLQKDKG